jgi:two-component system chemotaxis response regulator CheB
MKILIVDDSALVRGILKQLLLEQSDMVIIGEASNGQSGYEKNLELLPDIIIMDINMPVMDGLEATKKIMAERPVPILIFSSSIEAGSSFEAISAGAVDLMRKPDIDQLNEPEFVAVFIDKLKNLHRQTAQYGDHAGEPAAAARTAGPEPAAAANSASSTAAGAAGVAGSLKKPAVHDKDSPVIVIGASTGGPLAVREVLKDLPPTFSAGIAVVQHLEEGFDTGYTGWLNESTSLNVMLAGTQPQPFLPGNVTVAPVNLHLIVAEGKLTLDDGPKILNQKPAVDALFSTAAEWYGDRVIGVLLTGMGRDGAEGCRKIIAQGGHTLVQNRETSAIFGMPKAAIDLGAASEVVSLADIPKRLMEIVTEKEGSTV